MTLGYALQQSFGRLLMHMLPPRPMPTEEKPVTPIKYLFGRKDLHDVYRHAKSLIDELGLTLICNFTEDSDHAELTLFGTWRMRRIGNGSIELSELCYTTRRWNPIKVEDFPANRWPVMPLAPNNHAFTRKMLFELVDKIMAEAGFDSVVDPPRQERKSCPKSKVKTAIRSHFEKYLNWNAAERSFRKFFWRHMLDRDVLSAAVAINYRVDMKTYLYLGQNAPAVKRAAREHRNLLPLLLSISPSLWGREDLFADSLWIRSGRKSTLIDRANPKSLKTRGVHSFAHPEAWAWLKAASIRTVAYYAQTAACDSEDKVLLALARFSQSTPDIKIPVRAYRRIFYSDIGSWRRDEWGVLSLWLKECSAVWKAKGLTAVNEWMYAEHNSPQRVIRYMAAEGGAKGALGPTASIKSLSRKYERWRKEIERKEWRDYLDDKRHDRILEKEREFVWPPILGNLVVSGYRMEELTSMREIFLEGRSMYNCLWTNLRDEFRHGYGRAFRCFAPDGQRLTVFATCTDDSFEDVHYDLRARENCMPTAINQTFVYELHRLLRSVAQKKAVQGPGCTESSNHHFNED